MESLPENFRITRPYAANALHRDGPGSLAGRVQKRRLELFEARGKIGENLRRNFSHAPLGRRIRAMVRNCTAVNCAHISAVRRTASGHRRDAGPPIPEFPA